MRAFSQSLEASLHRALEYANERHHEYATLEHLLLALLDDRDAAPVMKACLVDFDALRRQVTDFLDNEPSGFYAEAQPTTGFQRVVHGAVVHVQGAGREEVTGTNVLVAIFAERESHAALFLQEQKMTRLDAAQYISHGIAKRAGLSEPKHVRGVVEGQDADNRAAASSQGLYKVLLLNDDYTPMEFVVQILERFFGKGREDATRIMLDVHREGVGICGAYAHEVANAKVWQVIECSRQNQHPLQCTMEKE